MADQLPIDVVVLCRNEEDRIERLLPSLLAFRRVVIIDSLSTDQSLDRARMCWKSCGGESKNLVLLSREWPGFTQARNESLKWVSDDSWVLWVDADERVSEALLTHLHTVDWNNLDKRSVFEIPRQSYFLGRAIRHGGWFPDYKKRLAHSTQAKWGAGPRAADVHEDLKYEKGHLLRAEGVLEHWPFRDEKDQVDTNQRYSSLLAQAMAKDWKAQQRSAPSRFLVYAKTFVKFVENYVFKLGFMDGMAGLKIAIGSAQSMNWRMQKLRQILLEDKCNS